MWPNMTVAEFPEAQHIGMPLIFSLVGIEQAFRDDQANANSGHVLDRERRSGAEICFLDRSARQRAHRELGHQAYTRLVDHLENTRYLIKAKLGVASDIELVLVALRQGILGECEDVELKSGRLRV